MPSISSLSLIEKELVATALTARDYAQAPYSGYHVGAAVLSASQKIFQGANVERANYTSTSHAEQTAIDKMISEPGSNLISLIAVVGAPQGSEPSAPVWPCGHCRGIIWENSAGNKDIKIITVTGPDNCEFLTIGELYPHPFGPEDLGIKIA